MRILVLYTPNYSVLPYEIVWDSDDSSVGLQGIKFKDSFEAVAYYRAIVAEDESVRMFHLSPKLDPKDFVEMYNKFSELSTDESMWLNDVGVTARKIVNNCLSCKAKFEQELDTLEDYYKGNNKYFSMDRWRNRRKK